MIPLNYHHLYYFWAVARRGSISAARRELYLSQPTLSAQLKELEKSLKLKLLSRGRSGMTLTPEGKEVFERCARIFAEGEELAAFVRGDRAAPALLRIGLRPTVTREVVLRVLKFAQKKDRSCRIAIFSAEAEALVAKLKRHEVDLIIANRDLSAGADLRGRLVSELPVYFVANRRVKRLVKDFPADLAKTELLLRPAGTPVRKQVDEYLDRRRLACAVAADSDDVDLLRRLAIEGRGAAVLSGLSIAADLKSGRLATLHASPTGIRESIWFICQAQPQANPGLRKMINALMGEFTIFGKEPAIKSRLGA